MVGKTTSVLYFCYILLQDSWFLHDLELTNLFLMFFDNTQIKVVFMHVNFNIINNICLMEN